MVVKENPDRKKKKKTGKILDRGLVNDQMIERGPRSDIFPVQTKPTKLARDFEWLCLSHESDICHAVYKFLNYFTP